MNNIFLRFVFTIIRTREENEDIDIQNHDHDDGYINFNDTVPNHYREK